MDCWPLGWRRAGAFGSRIVPAGVVAVATVWLYRRLLTSVAFQSHEGLAPCVRVHEYLHEFAHGHWIPQVLPDAVRGSGSAFPRFYPPFAYVFSAALAWVTGDVFVAVNLSFLLAALLSAVAMYCLVVIVTGDRLAATASGLLYVSVPYRFVDVFVRGDLAEAWSFVWYPLILAGTWRVLTTRRIPWYLPVVWAGSILTHAITDLYFVLFYAALVIVVLIRERAWRVPALLVAAGAIGVGLSLWFVVPQQMGLHAERVSDARFMGADHRAVVTHRVSVPQLVGSPRTVWRGPSPPTTAATYAACRSACPVDFTLGTGQLLAVAFAIGVLVATAVARRVRHGAVAPHAPHAPPDPVSGDREATTWLLGLALVGWLGAFVFMVRPSPFLRALPGAFGFIQFPWRVLGLSALFAALLLGLATATTRARRAVELAVVGAMVVLVLTVPGYLRSSKPYAGSAGRSLRPRLHGASTDLGFTVLGEYQPKTLDPRRIAAELPKLPAITRRGAVLDWHRSNGELVARVDVDAPSVVTFPIVHYDFYRVVGNGSRRLPTFDNGGFLAARVPASTRTLTVAERLTPESVVGLVASGVAALSLGGMLVRRRRAAAVTGVRGPRPAKAGAHVDTPMTQSRTGS